MNKIEIEKQCIEESDNALIEQTIRTNLKLITSINSNSDYDGLIFSKELLARGIEVLQQKKFLTELERRNLQRFNNKWSSEIK